MLQINDTTYGSAPGIISSGNLVPADYMFIPKPKADQPHYQYLKDFHETWSGSKFKPTRRMVFYEMVLRGWVPNDFIAKKKWRNKR